MKMIWFPVTKSQFWLPQNPLEMSTGNPSTEFCNDKADGNIPRCPFKYPLVWLGRLTVLQPYWLHFSLFTCFFLCFSVRLMQRLLLPQKHNQKQKNKAFKYWFWHQSPWLESIRVLWWNAIGSFFLYYNVILPRIRIRIFTPFCIHLR